jgi:hypothetical protein
LAAYAEKAIYTGGRDTIAKKAYIRALGYKSPTFDANVAKVKSARAGNMPRCRPDTTQW